MLTGLVRVLGGPAYDTRVPNREMSLTDAGSGGTLYAVTLTTRVARQDLPRTLVIT